MSAMERITGIGLGTPLQYPYQTAALQLGHFAPKAVIGAHVTRLLSGNKTDPGLSSLRLSEEVGSLPGSTQGRRCRCWSGAADEAELWAYDERGEAAASGAEQQRVAPISRIG
jgi:hypothetical protein